MWFILAVLSAFFNAFANVARRTHGSLAEPAELAWWGLTISIPFGVGLVLISGQTLWTSTAFLVPAVLAAVIDAYGEVLLLKAYKYGDASAISPLGNLLPIALVLTSLLLLHAAPSPAGLLGIMLIVAGVYYSSVSGKHSLLGPLRQIGRNRGSRAMLLWVVLMAFSTIFIQQSIRHASVSFVMLFMLTIEWVILSVYLLLRPAKHRLRRGEKVWRRWGWHMAAIALFSTVSVFFQYQAMKLISSSYVLAIKRVDVLITIVLAGFFLRERHILRRFKGSAIAVLGVVILFLVA